MESKAGKSSKVEQFPESIGKNYELWERYHETHGDEAYKYRRLYEEASSQLNAIYDYAEENDITLPDSGPNFA